MNNISTKIPEIHPNYPELLEKLFKYTLNEKDIELSQKYHSLLEKMCRKMPDWFKYEYNRAQQ